MKRTNNHTQRNDEKMFNEKQNNELFNAIIDMIDYTFDNARTNTRNDDLIICDVATSTHASRVDVDVDDEFDNAFVDMKLSCM
jgi:hypothetical protein